MSPLVTHIDQRRGGRTRLTVDGEEHDLPTEDVLLAGLRIDHEIDEAAWAELRRDGRRRLAVRVALQMIARRSRTEADLRSRLGREFEPDAAAYAAARLRELRYVDDQAWAESYLERPRSRGRSRSVLRAELRRHGVPDDVIEDVLTSHDDPEAAARVARTRWRQLRRRSPTDRDRLLRAYLYRRGFSPDEVSAAVRACQAEEAADAAIEPSAEESPPEAFPAEASADGESTEDIRDVHGSGGGAHALRPDGLRRSRMRTATRAARMPRAATQNAGDPTAGRTANPATGEGPPHRGHPGDRPPTH